jgi:thiazole synthase ThiGH ThiG subunit
VKDYLTYTIKKRVGCGAVYCLFMEDEGAFYKLFVKGNNAKETPCGEAMLNTLAKILTFALRRGFWEGSIDRGILKQLKNERCNMAVPNKEGVVSCADAIGKAVSDYIQIRAKNEISAKAV